MSFLDDPQVKSQIFEQGGKILGDLIRSMASRPTKLTDDAIDKPVDKVGEPVVQQVAVIERPAPIITVTKPVAVIEAPASHTNEVTRGGDGELDYRYECCVPAGTKVYGKESIF